jgi:MFS family permease
LEIMATVSKPRPEHARNARAQRARVAGGVESPYAWVRLAAAVILSTIGGVGMWSVVVALPAVQAEFGAARAGASFPYMLTMIGFGFSGIAMGRLADRHGILLPVVLGAVIMSVGYLVAGTSATLWQYALAQGLLIGAGSAATFAPLLADISHWFDRRRGTAVGIAASGNYLAGAVWSPIVEHFIAVYGWRATSYGIAVFCVATMLPLALLLRRRAPAYHVTEGMVPSARRSPDSLGLSPAALQTLLIIAGVACCVAMSMPQVHLVAYCGDLGYGPARGARMLALMMVCGIVSRLTFGVISDRIGGLRTLLLGSGLQCVALILFLPYDGLVWLYLVAALFGLFQGGIVPSYAIIIREFFSPTEAGARLGSVIMATLFGMALGGWMSGMVFDLTGSYKAAFLNGIAWNLVNLSIATWLLRRQMRGGRRYASA